MYPEIVQVEYSDRHSETTEFGDLSKLSEFTEQIQVEVTEKIQAKVKPESVQMASPAPNAAPAVPEENEAPDTEPKDTQSKRGRKTGDRLYIKATLHGKDTLDAETYSEDHRLVAVQGNADPEDGVKWYKYAGKSNPSGSKFACLS